MKTNVEKEMFCGEKNYKMTPEMELYSMVCTSILTPTYYVKNTDTQLDRLKTLIKQVNPHFVAQIAVYAREKMYLRTIPMVLTAELAKIHNGDDLIRRLTKRIIQRADEITGMLDTYVKANKRIGVTTDGSTPKVLNKLSNQLRKGIADSFMKFDEYQFAKYNRKTDIALIDALRLVHPKPDNEERSDLFKKIKESTLKVPYTWETELTKAGQEGRDKGEVWEELIKSGKLGYMALLRNLRNFLITGVSKEGLQMVAERLSDPKQIKRSRQLPFRFLSAYRMLAGLPYNRYGFTDKDKDKEISPEISNNIFLPVILDALEIAVLYSADNIPAFNNVDVLLASDVSGSMQHSISPRSIVQNYDIGALLMMLAQTKCNSATIGMFGDTWKVLDDLSRENILQSTNEIHSREGEVGYSTNGYKVIQWANKMNIKYDRVMIFTDCQMWNSDIYGRRSAESDISKEWKTYRIKHPEAKLYLFNLQPYGQVPLEIKKNGVYLISGWSDKIFDALASLERGQDVLDEIREIRL